MTAIGRVGDPRGSDSARRFLCGHGRYVADLSCPGTMHVAFVRAPYAHARFTEIDIGPALEVPDVVAVLTGADMACDRVGPMRSFWPVGLEPDRFALARERVRFAGEAVALVISRTLHGAIDGAEAVQPDWEELPAESDAAQALAADAPLLHDGVPGNLAFNTTRGDLDAIEEAIASAPHSVRIRLRNNRLAGMAIEPRAVMAEPSGGRVTLHSTTQVPHHIRRLVAEQLGMAENALRVIAPDVGGGFGYKGKHYPEETALVWAARRTGLPLRWVSGRSEAFLTDCQGRDHLTEATLGFDNEGVFLALKVDTIANLGAWVSTFGAAIPSNIYAALLAGVYRTPLIHVRVRGAFTNTPPTDAYRGAGRPEACHLLERLADLAAREIGLDPIELRRRNLIQPDQMPYAAPTGPTYDSGDFPAMLSAAERLSDWSGFDTRRNQSRARGRLRGRGVACFVESSGVAPSGFAAARGARTALYEAATLRAEPGGSVQLLVGTHSHGQDHATSYARIVAERLGISEEQVLVIEGDTDLTPYGTGTFGSRSMAVGGSAIARAADKVVEKGRALAAAFLDADAEEVEFQGGFFGVPGTNRRMSFSELADRACIPGADFPYSEFEPGLQATAVYDPPNFAYSNGAHVAEVEIDPETGKTWLVSYCAVDDIGRVISPTIAEAQVHGGVSQGAGQALMEHMVYNIEGQALSGSLMDYALPRAGDLPFIFSAFDENQPCAHNPLGVKGVGEAGAIAAPAAISGAVADALVDAGADPIDMPFSPVRVWNALEAARAGQMS